MSDDESMVSVEVLRQVINRTLDNLQAHAGDRVELDHDFFWSVPPELTYAVYTQPQPEQLTIGQLSESWNNLARVNEADGGVPAYALVWLSEVLKALAHQTR